MKVEFHPEADVELAQAVEYYENKRKGLGGAFFDEVSSALQRITRFPTAWAILSRRSRRCVTNRFPYGVVYRVKGSTVLVVAIAHLHRKPGYWLTREQKS
jgi:hypothetical protein